MAHVVIVASCDEETSCDIPKKQRIAHHSKRQVQSFSAHVEVASCDEETSCDTPKKQRIALLVLFEKKTFQTGFF